MLDPGADGCLGEVQGLGGFAEVARMVELQKGPEQFQVHGVLKHNFKY